MLLRGCGTPWGHQVTASGDADDALLASRRNRNHLKARLQQAGLLPRACQSCGIDEWLGRPLSLALHHVNGNGHDNRLENLQVLCPNCHSQTDTFAGRNRGRRAA